MAAYAFKERIEPDEIVFHFDGGSGVDARDLGEFLKVAGKVAEKKGARLDIVAIERGSLSVKSKIKKRFDDDPLKAIEELVTIVAGALAASAVLASCAQTMLGGGGVDSVEIFTKNSSAVLMDSYVAGERPLREVREKRPRVKNHDQMKHLVASALEGKLIGDVHLVDGKVYFRPGNYQFMVPVRTTGIYMPYQNARYIVEGYIVLTKDGQPEELVVNRAKMF